MEFVKYPNEIANVVFSELNRRIDAVPSEDILVDLFDTMYYAISHVRKSMKGIAEL